MKEFKHLGAYALIIKDEKILLIKKHGGPYDGTLDLPGGTIEFGETPVEALKRELKEEVGIEAKEYELFDADSVAFDWQFNDDIIKVHHTGIFFKVIDYSENIKLDIKIDNKNDDSLGADFYEISKLKQKDLSIITLLELNKLGYLL
ncbi:MAG: NUDIX domain-containing protein [Firmicutes bacterium]|nr:NUDIX domain-containing protein [Bacillota bacterium]